MPDKFALLSPVAPPSWSGQAIVIGRVLRGLDPGSYCIITRQGPDAAEDFTGRLPGAYEYLPPDLAITGPGLGQRQRRARVWANVLRQGMRIRGMLRKHGCSAVVAATADLSMLPAAYLAARLSRARFYAYLFDDYTYQWPDPLMRSMAQRFERHIFPRAAGLIAPNEFLAREIENRHGLTPGLVRNPCEGLPPVEAVRGEEDEVAIVFTGAIYHVNFGAFRNLLEGMARPGMERARLHLYTAIEPGVLQQEGIWGGQVVYHGHVPPEKVAGVQARADVLFLPFALDMLPEIVKTSCPGKLADYLASGTPILSQASKESFVYWYLREHDCGLVVDQDDPGALAGAVQRLGSDPELRERLGANARGRAEADFSPVKAQADFLRILGGAA